MQKERYQSEIIVAQVALQEPEYDLQKQPAESKKYFKIAG